MAILRLQLEIDSEVHPELYARLASLGRFAAREEKLRQLAATGLIWEIARLSGPAFTDPDAAALPAGELPSGDAATEAPDPDPATIDAGAMDDHPAWMPADVPMLTDIVTEAETGVDIEAAAPADESATTAKVVPLHDARRDGKTRSARLKRMKDLGLFQNG
jgi:hypothetical protein